MPSSPTEPADERQVQALKVKLLDLVDNLQQMAVSNSATVMESQIEKETTTLFGRLELQNRLLQEENESLKSAVIARESQMARMFADVCKVQHSAGNKSADHETLADALQQISFKAFKTLDQSLVPNQPSVMTPLVVDATLSAQSPSFDPSPRSSVSSLDSFSEASSLASLSPQSPQSPNIPGSKLWASPSNQPQHLPLNSTFGIDRSMDLQLGVISEFHQHAHQHHTLRT